METSGHGVEIERARQAVVLADANSADEVIVVDVSSWGEVVDVSRIAAVGDPVLVCFGGHSDDLCPAHGVQARDGVHGVVFNTVSGRRVDVDLVDRFRKLSREDLPVRVTQRPPANPNEEV